MSVGETDDDRCPGCDFCHDDYLFPRPQDKVVSPPAPGIEIVPSEAGPGPGPESASMDPATPVRFGWTRTVGAEPTIFEVALEEIIPLEELRGMTRQCVEKRLVVAHAEWLHKHRPSRTSARKAGA